MPQLALQQVSPTLQVCMPHDWLSGYVIVAGHGRSSQRSPGRVQVPQLALQQTSPTLQVLMPQLTL